MPASIKHVNLYFDRCALVALLSAEIAPEAIKDKTAERLQSPVALLQSVLSAAASKLVILEAIRWLPGRWKAKSSGGMACSGKASQSMWRDSGEDLNSLLAACKEYKIFSSSLNGLC